ncbi:MAG: hypothetical protein LQ338_006208 [Usnochroma carphineum]|nr:MAG: hypothetical protein LQ338_007886 [Usnochroma carphineum]KAI4121718.1 MAG: hypothetical protein LQ338_006208 [Usnochroma carphineum]
MTCRDGARVGILPHLKATIDDQTATTLRLPQTNVQASLHQCPPENTLAAAVKSFKGSGWLTSTAIQLTLGKLPSNNVKIFDPSYMETANAESILRKRSKSDWLNVFSFFPTNHHGSHWTLMIYDPSNREVEFYGSLPCTSYETEAERAMRCCIEAAQNGQHGSVEVSFQRKDCPGQQNASDCGVFVILCATRRILGQPMPFAFDYRLWRIILYAVLSQSLPEKERRRSTIVTTTPATNNNTSSLPLDDLSTLTQEFNEKAHEHKLAGACSFWAQDAIDILDIILKKLFFNNDVATDRLRVHQKALDEHRGALDHDRKIEILYVAVILAFEAAIESMG